MQLSNSYKRLITINLVIFILLLLITAIGLDRYKLYLFNNSRHNVIYDVTKFHISEKIIDKSKIASILIIIGELGITNDILNKTLLLPKEIVLGVSAYASNVKNIVDQIKNSGHECLINIPMEPNNYPLTDPGPYALQNKISDEENISRISFFLDKNLNIDGIYSNLGEVFTSKKNHIELIVDLLKQYNLYYVNGNGKSEILSNKYIQDNKFPIILSDITIDKEINSKNIEDSLAELEKIALTNGIAIGMANGYPITLNLLNAWLPSLNAKNIKLTTLKTIMKKNVESQ